MSMKNRTETRKQIIKNLAKLQNQKPEGFSSYDLESVNISRRTFRDHEKEMIEKYLIEISRKETRGKQERTYYQFTTLGQIASLGFYTHDELGGKVEEITKVSPLIGGYWRELCNIFDKDVVINIFESCIQNITVQTLISQSSKDDEEIITNQKRIISKIDFPLHGFSLSRDEYYFTKPTEKQKRVIPEASESYDSRYEMNEIEELIFIFYYSCISELNSHMGNEVFCKPPKTSNQKEKKQWDELKSDFKNRYSKLTKLIENDVQLKKIIDAGFERINDCMKLTENIEKTYKKYDG